MVANVQASIVPTAESDGILYSNAVPLTPTEADLFGGTNAQQPDPIPVSFGASVLAIIKLAVVGGYINGNSTLIVMQMDLGDGNWVDIDWAVFTQNQGSAVVVFSNGVAGAGVFQNTRNAGSMPTPQSNGSNQTTLAGRIRFVGFTNISGGSSGVLGASPPQVQATIRYKLLGLR